MTKHLAITIDGPVGAGKSAVARQLAAKIGVRYLDTGAMYRAVTLKALRSGIDMNDETALTQAAQSAQITLTCTECGTLVLLDGEDVSTDIRSLQVTNHAYKPSQTPGVRLRMVELQRLAALDGPLVAEGRDMGTVVFPDSPAKFYLDASIDVRTRRRLNEYIARGEKIEFDELKQQIITRDQRDSTRDAAPLRRADDAQYIDSSGMSIDDVVSYIINTLGARGLLDGQE